MTEPAELHRDGQRVALRTTEAREVLEAQQDTHSGRRYRLVRWRRPQAAPEATHARRGHHQEDRAGPGSTDASNGGRCPPSPAKAEAATGRTDTPTALISEVGRSGCGFAPQIRVFDTRADVRSLTAVLARRTTNLGPAGASPTASRKGIHADGTARALQSRAAWAIPKAS